MICDSNYFDYFGNHNYIQFTIAVIRVGRLCLYPGLNTSRNTHTLTHNDRHYDDNRT